MRLTSTLALATACAVGGLAGPLAAQEVTLRSQDESINISGELVEFENDIYILRTNLGTLRISADRVDCFGEACPFQEPEPEPEVAGFVGGPVTLQARDGSVEIQGNLTGFENEIYSVETGFGVLEISVIDAVCIGDACPVVRRFAKDIKLAASSELSSDLVANLAEGFAAANGASFGAEQGEGGVPSYVLTAAGGELLASVDLTSLDSTSAVQTVVDGKADIAALTRSIRQDERTALLGEATEGSTRGEREIILALDALSVIVSPSNPVRVIGEAELSRIFAGEVTDWAQLGGQPGPVNLYVRSSDSGTGTVFNDLVMQPSGQGISVAANVLASDADITQAVMQDPNGIGYTNFSSRSRAKAIDIRGECGIQTPASEFTIKTEEYPLTRRIYMYRPEASIPETAVEFIDYIKTNAAQTIVGETGYVDQNVKSVSVNEQGLRFAAMLLPTEADVTYEDIQSMVSSLVSSDRLSLTFRFESGSARLDTRAQGDVLRLAQMIDSGAFDNKELLVIGFTDSLGVGDINASLSQARAEQVREAVLAATQTEKAVGVPISAIGYGELSPLGCNETANGRRINRRVEIWTRDLVAETAEEPEES